MKILFIHPTIPSQYIYLAKALAEDNEVVFLANPSKVEMPNISKAEYISPNLEQSQIDTTLIPMEMAVLASREVLKACEKMKKDGFIPDIICAHLGWGHGMFLKDVYPDSPILTFCEFFYNTQNDTDFLKYKITADDRMRKRVLNMIHTHNLIQSDWGICPTQFQLDQHPEEFHSKISLLHEGIDTNRTALGTGKRLKLPDVFDLGPQDEIITYVSRSFEPVRGFPQFIQAAEIILKNRPNCHIIMAGTDTIGYSQTPEDDKSYREMIMEEADIDLSRFHYLGLLPYNILVKVLQISSAHIYLTAPFVLSWSMLDAMACGCVVIGSDTEPVREVIEDGKNGLLVDFFSPDDIAKSVDKVFAHNNRMQEISDNARKTIVDHYSVEKLLPKHISLVKDIASGRTPTSLAS